MNDEVTLRPQSQLQGKKGLELSLYIPVSKGHSEIQVIIGAEDYPALVRAMADADREEALKAMAGEVFKRLSKRR